MAYYGRRRRKEPSLFGLGFGLTMAFALMAFPQEIGNFFASYMMPDIQPVIEQTANPQR